MNEFAHLLREAGRFFDNLTLNEALERWSKACGSIPALVAADVRPVSP